MSDDEKIDSAEHQSSDGSDGLDDSQRDNSSATNRNAIVAKPTDIVCGRGFHITNHRGNLSFHLLVNEFREEYLSSKRPSKTRITKHVLKEVKMSGSRFIQKVTDKNNRDTWEEVDYATAYKKVSHALRLRGTNETNSSTGSIKPTVSKREADTRNKHRKGESNRESEQATFNKPATLPAVAQNDPFSGQLHAPSGIPSYPLSGQLHAPSTVPSYPFSSHLPFYPFSSHLHVTGVPSYPLSGHLHAPRIASYAASSHLLGDPPALTAGAVQPPDLGDPSLHRIYCETYMKILRSLHQQTENPDIP